MQFREMGHIKFIKNYMIQVLIYSHFPLSALEPQYRLGQ